MAMRCTTGGKRPKIFGDPNINTRSRRDFVNKPLVVNFFAGPGAGKTTLAASVFSELKWCDINCEFATEFAKDLTWEERFNALENQFYVFGKQFHRINRLIDKVDVIITDSPLLLSIVYKPEWINDCFDKVVLDTFSRFNNLNFFVDRVKQYNQEGRIQTEEEARKIDNAIETLLLKNDIPYYAIDGERSSVDFVIAKIFGRLGKNLKNQNKGEE